MGFTASLQCCLSGAPYHRIDPVADGTVRVTLLQGGGHEPAAFPVSKLDKATPTRNLGVEMRLH